MSNFGSRVIGHEKAKKEAEISTSRSDHFGPRVIGEVHRRRKQLAEQAVKDSRATPKKRRTEPAPEPVTEVVTEAATPEAKAKQRADTQEEEIRTIEAPTTTNFQELQDALKGNPAFYEGLYSAELVRLSGARKSALRLFLVFEMEHENREERKAEIEAALVKKK